MGLSVSISGSDRTRLIAPDSLKITNVLTTQVDSASFLIRKFGARTLVPAVGNEVIVTLDGTRIFGGRIVTVNAQYDKLDIVGYNVDCVDYTRDLDKKLVIETYEDMTVDAIIADIATNYLPAAITTTNVDCATNINFIAFNYEYVSSILQQLADLTNCDWYIDYNKDIHFFARDANPAPFGLTDTNGKYVYQTLSIKEDISKVRNTIIVRGGDYLGDNFTVEAYGDGVQNTFPTQYQFNSLQVSVTGVLQTVGVDPLDQDNVNNYDCLYNFQEKFIRFRSPRIPRASKLVKIFGLPYLPVIIKLRDNSAIADMAAAEGTDGIYEYKITDPSITSKEAARQRARAELLTYAATLEEGSFITFTDGLRSGMQINIQSTIRGLNADYIINRVRATVVGTGAGSIKLQYEVSLVTTRTFGYIEFLRKLLTDKDKQIIIAEDEVLDEVESCDDSMSIDDSILTTTLEGRNYQYGPGGVPQGRYNLSSYP